MAARQSLMSACLLSSLMSVRGLLWVLPGRAQGYLGEQHEAERLSHGCNVERKLIG
ncbi:hypothetical protein GUITHDRAFT_156442 [Guillardia theta CCMP2712]|uniref:Uncharacterized protein n=1 Tax=Guillardia theta (strain CCMP2712) TaxID=905079 RepID=L1I6S2_GUITC|nr:hypothetical protein GUITHDRAFT_156442 [Guillardia theta CCMP2712]EKX31958.1 hypothetical protein GUITHDRAFT_156442 [Guillardia theta CCMP2712]|eukprot:XP_005818938.1 hypothetical protein GUITHDRAFT_156442 [Guillardia theta CCMP2712]